MAMPQHRHLALPQTPLRLKHINLPTGRKIRVASTPDEADQIKKTLEKLQEDIDLVVHGSEEHIRALQTLHEHHEQERTQLRDRHGKQFEEIEANLRHMDDLAEELKAVAEHAERFDSSFMKFGYSDKIRIMSKDANHDCPTLTAETNTNRTPSTHDWLQERENPKSIKFFLKPVVRQYEHKGFLWRSPVMQTVSTYELFIDLLYVGVIEVAGDEAAEEATGHSLLRFVIVFLMGWKIYSELTIFMAWFDAEDILRRLTVLWCLACLIGFTTNQKGFYEDTYTALVSFYLAIAFGRSAYQFWYAYIIKMIRSTLISVAIIGLLGAVFWIGSIHAQAESTRQILVWIALFIDIFGYETLRLIGKASEQFPRTQQWLTKHFEFVPGISIEHRVERMSSFVMLVFGYSILSLFFQNRSTIPLTAFLGKAILSLIQVFSLSSIYFEMDQVNLYTHAIRHHPLTSVLWSFAHIPLTLGFTLSASALSRIVLTHDSLNANPESLYEPYNLDSEESIEIGLRWYYCAGLGTTLLSTCIIAQSHIYKRSKHVWYTRPWRLILRFIISIIIMILPILGSLNSVNLIATTTGLIFISLLSDLVGNMLAETNPSFSHHNSNAQLSQGP